MIVRDPEKRAQLDQVVSDIWYKQSDYDELEENTFLVYQTVPMNDHQKIIRQMVEGKIATEVEIIK